MKTEVFCKQINTLNLIISHCNGERRLKGENITMHLSNCMHDLVDLALNAV